MAGNITKPSRPEFPPSGRNPDFFLPLLPPFLLSPSPTVKQKSQESSTLTI